MTSGTPLPERLQYLQPMRNHLARFKRNEEVAEANTNILRRSIVKRTKSLPARTIQPILEEDARELEEWLNLPGRTEVDLRMYFLLPLLSVGRELMAPKEPETLERGEISMELPEGAKVTVEYGSWSVKWKRFNLLVCPQHMEQMGQTSGQLKQNAKERPMINDVGEEIQEVRYGEVFGIKGISKTGPPRSKCLNYALTVPGGYAIALLYPPSINSDEQRIEAYFHTIKVLNYPPAPLSSDGVG